MIGAVTGVTFGAAGKGIKALKIAPKVVKAAPKLTKAAKKLTPAARRYVRKIAKPASKAGQKSARSSKKATRKISTKINKAAKKANPQKCFIAGTLIATEEGDEPIEDVKEGDLVYSEDPETGEIALKRVVRTFVNQTEDLVHVSIDGQVITTTQEHPFWNPRCGWTDAGDLRAGDELLLRSGEVVVIEAIWYEILDIPVTVYNFEVEDFHTYFVSSSGILVHNKAMKSKAPNMGDALIKDLQKLPKNKIKELGGESATSKMKKFTGGSKANLYLPRMARCTL